MEHNTTIRCVKCKYFQVTWDVEKPYGCNKLGFKSRIEPSTYVTQVSGNTCKSFILKILG